MKKNIRTITALVGILVIAATMMFVWTSRNSKYTIGKLSLIGEENKIGNFNQLAQVSLDHQGNQMANSNDLIEDNTLTTQPKYEIAYGDEDIDTYLKARRASEVPNPEDFNESYSDL
jgi:hypothetical protein